MLWLDRKQSRGKNLFSKSVSHLERFPGMVKCLTVVGQSTHGSSQDSWLSDNHMMVEELIKDFENNPKPNIKIADLLRFAQQIGMIHEKLALQEERNHHSGIMRRRLKMDAWKSYTFHCILMIRIGLHEWLISRIAHSYSVCRTLNF